MTVLYYSNLESISTDLFSQALQMVPSETSNRARRYRRMEDATAHIFGRLLLDRILNRFEIESNLEDLKYTEFHRPYLMSGGLDFNISHSGDYVVCIGSNAQQVGIDIERKVAIDLADYKSCFSLAEWNEIYSASSTLDKFYEFWTKKEAILKAEGTGLSVSPLCIDLSKGMNQVSLSKVWSPIEVSLADCYKCSVALENFDTYVEVELINFR